MAIKIDGVKVAGMANDPQSAYQIALAGGYMGTEAAFNETLSNPIKFSDIYPIGSIYMSVNNVNPGVLFGGTWAQIQDTFLLAAGSSYAAGATGGEASHTLTVDEMPSHTHTFTGISHNHTASFTGTEHTHTFTGTAHNHTGSISSSVKGISSVSTGSRESGPGGSTTVNSITQSTFIGSVTINNATAGGTNAKTTAGGTVTNTAATAGGTNSSTGNGEAFTNMPPYLVVYMWQRTA